MSTTSCNDGTQAHMISIYAASLPPRFLLRKLCHEVRAKCNHQVVESSSVKDRKFDYLEYGLFVSQENTLSSTTHVPKGKDQVAERPSIVVESQSCMSGSPQFQPTNLKSGVETRRGVESLHFSNQFSMWEHDSRYPVPCRCQVGVRQRMI